MTLVPAAPSRTPARPARALGLAAAVLLVATGCAAGDDPGTAGGGDAGGDAAGGDPVAVATTTQLGSILDEITACAGTSSATVMGPGDDPHDFSPSSRQVAQMTSAELVVSNGLGLEAGMQTALDNAQADGATLLEVAPALDPIPFATEGVGGHDHGEEGHADHEHSERDHNHGALDPHVWMDVSRMATAAGVMGDALADEAGEDAYADCGDEVAAELERTDAEVREILAEIPEDRRALVADHDAYGYFADAYGFEVSGIVVPGGSTTADPSSERLAELVAAIEQEGADVFVTSAGAQNRLITSLSAETGGEVPVVELYEGGVGPEGSGVETYSEAMVFNARALADALS